MTAPAGISKYKQLIVEGKDQQNFFEALLDHLGLQKDIQIQNFGGISQLRGFVSALAKMPRFFRVTSLGIIRDAENSATAAFSSIQSSLQNAGLPVPTKIGISTAGNPKVDVFVLPDNLSSGMLETLIYRSIKRRKVDQCIQDFFRCSSAATRVHIRNPDKARVNAYLATTARPRHSVGIAARAGVWNLDHSAFRDIRNFLSSI